VTVVEEPNGPRSFGIRRFCWCAGDGRSGAALWPRTETRHGEVRAYDLEHRALLRRFAAGSLRERAPWQDTGRKMTYAARLPPGSRAPSSRDEVLRAVDPMRASLRTG
jgi:hypothetical protein